MKKTIATLALVILAGCAPPPPISVTGPNAETPYQWGYRDGCRSGQFAGGLSGAEFTKNVSEFHKSKMYVEGWNDGFAICKGRTDDFHATMNSVLGH